MPDDDKLFDLTRRKVLGSIGALGAGAALGGAGTAAFFSDTETFQDNTLVAGALDLTVDWEEHYYMGDLGGIDLQYSKPPDETADTYVGFPDPDNPHVWINQNDVGAFMDATSLEAYPDTNVDGGDGIQDNLEGYVACDDFAQLGENLNPDNGRGTGARSANADTILNYDAYQQGEGTVDPNPAPLVNLQDIKPGDFGELTLSAHLCDNPGYLWLQGDLVDADENGVTEPESQDGNEIGPGDTDPLNRTLFANEGDESGDPGDIDPADTTQQPVELLDEIQTMLWYDENGNNVYEPGGVTGKADIMLVLDDSGSMGGGGLAAAQSAAVQLIETVGDNAQIGVVGFNSQASMEQKLTLTKQDAKDAVNGLSAGGRTNIEQAIDMAHEELDGHDVCPQYDASGNNRTDAQPIIVLLTDGTPNEGYESQGLTDPTHDDDNQPNNGPYWSDFGEDNPADNAEHLKEQVHDVTMYTVGFGGISSGSTEADLLDYMATPDGGSFIGAQSELFSIFSQIAKDIAGEKQFFRGSLRDLLVEVSDGNGIPLDGTRATPFDEVAGDGLNDGDPSDPTSDVRDEFVNSTTNAVGLAWWLPVDHANEIQTDSVQFDLGFYTEQARHNDGAGMVMNNSTNQSAD